MIMLALGFTSSTKSLFPDEIAKAIGQERSLVSIKESCRYISTAVVNLFFGALIARFGAKKLIIAGFISLISSMLLFSVAENLVLIYVAGALLGIFVSANTAGYVLGAPLLNLCYDVMGSYVPALIIVSIIMAVMLVLLQLVISAAHKERKKIMALEKQKI